MGINVVVVDPDQVILGDDLFEFGGEMIVDAEIAAEIAPGEFRQIETIMQDRPQHAVGEAVVVFLVVVFGKVGDDILDVFVFDGLGFQFVSFGDLAAPAEPDAAVFLERRPQRDFKPASALGVNGWNGYAVGYDD